MTPSRALHATTLAMIALVSLPLMNPVANAAASPSLASLSWIVKTDSGDAEASCGPGYTYCSLAFAVADHACTAFNLVCISGGLGGGGGGSFVDAGLGQAHGRGLIVKYDPYRELRQSSGNCGWGLMGGACAFLVAGGGFGCVTVFGTGFGYARDPTGVYRYPIGLTGEIGVSADACTSDLRNSSADSTQRAPQLSDEERTALQSNLSARLGLDLVDLTQAVNESSMPVALRASFAAALASSGETAVGDSLSIPFPVTADGAAANSHS